MENRGRRWESVATAITVFKVKLISQVADGIKGYTLSGKGRRGRDFTLKYALLSYGQKHIFIMPCICTAFSLR